MVEDKYVFDEDEHEPGFVQKLSDIGGFIWNSKTKEFCGRDGASWAKVSLFYGVFYTLLGGFFIGMLAVFYAVTPKTVPTYYGVSSIMNSRSAPLNPGLGFRPQIDVEDHLIRYNSAVRVNQKEGGQKYSDSLKQFLRDFYGTQAAKDTIECQANKTYEDEFKNGKACRFDYETAFPGNDECIAKSDFGYDKPTPCVLIKLNKIVSWVPETGNLSYVVIRCRGESAFDVDNIREITYYSEHFPKNNVEGHISNKYFPFWAKKQPSYRAPFIWAKFNVTADTLINVECKAFANNIDNTDRLNRRGATKFTLFVSTGKN